MAAPAFISRHPVDALRGNAGALCGGLLNTGEVGVDALDGLVRLVHLDRDDQLELVIGGRRPSGSWVATMGESMKLPNGERAIVDVQKLRAYCLNPQHPRGRNKARVFASVGIREADVEELRAAILAAATDAEARLGVPNPYGQRYVVDFDFVREGRTVRIRSTWIVRIGEHSPRLTSCYVL